MSHKLINLNPDLKKLRDEGFEIEVKNAHLLVHGVPYVNSKKEIAFGILVTALEMAGEKTIKPQDHVIHFKGEHPCDRDGNILTGIQNASVKKVLVDGIEIDHSFSNRPAAGYTDYHEKVTTYVKIISAHAGSIDPTVTAKKFKVIESDDPESPLNYIDTNSSKAEIMAISEKLQNLKIAIIGLGGTGSYVLDFVAKTPVKEIHIFDNDIFYSHNAFRSPGAASIADLNKQPKKVAYLHGIYSKMHKAIIPHEYHMTTSVFNELAGMSFVFICIDNGEIKKEIIRKLIELRMPFVDVGIGITVEDGLLRGSVRTTTCTSEKHDHIDSRIPFSNDGDDDYHKDIQIAEINALNAAFAVVKWKKMFGFYHDLEKEHHSVYDIEVNKIINDETGS